MKKKNCGAATLGGKVESNLLEGECSNAAHGANKKRGAKLKNTLRTSGACW